MRVHYCEASVPKPSAFARANGDGEIRTLDPLLARQVLSQLSYTPIGCGSSLYLQRQSLLNYDVCLTQTNGLKWTRTTDLTLIRRAL